MPRLFSGTDLSFVERIDTKSKAGLPPSCDDLTDVSHDVPTVDALERQWAEEVAAAALKGRAPSLLRVLLRANTKLAVMSVLFRLLYEGMQVTFPFVLRALLLWLAEPAAQIAAEGALGQGYIFAIVLAVVNVLTSVGLACSVDTAGRAAWLSKNTMMMLIYAKTLRLPADVAAQKQGLIIALYSNDAGRLRDLHYAASAVIGPFCIVLYCGALYLFIGFAGLVAVAILVVTMPLQSWLTQRMSVVREGMSKAADWRLQRVNELLQGVRICKFMGWEGEFERDIQQRRAAEVSFLGTVFSYRAIVIGTSNIMTPLMQFTVFAVAYALGVPPTTANVFPVISILMALRGSLTAIALAVGRLSDLRVSLERMGDFLSLEEKTSYVRHIEDASLGMAVRNASFGFRETLRIKDERAQEAVPIATFTPILKDVTLNLPKGALIIVIGSTASGKSTLLSGLVGELEAAPVSVVEVTGSVSYVPQDAWVMNATVRNNITLGQPLDEQRYIEVLMACRLDVDIAQLPGGDATEIGERGVNLSGGQKQRLALARAAYAGRDIVLMDDPLSAVDPHVCQSLVTDCILGTMAGRTRVLVTHQVQFLPYADYVVCLKDCDVVFAGPKDLFDEQVEMVRTPHITPSNLRDSFNISFPHTPKAELFFNEFATSTVSSGTSGQRTSMNGSSTAFPDAPVKRDTRRTDQLRKQLGFLHDVNDVNPSHRHGATVSEEQQVEGAVSLWVYAWLVKQGGICAAVMMLIAVAVWRASNMLGDLSLSWWSSRKAPFGGASLSDLEYMQWAGISYLVCVAAVVARQVLFVWWVRGAAEATHGGLMRSLLHAPTAFFDTTPVGRILNRVGKDLETVSLTVPEELYYLVESIVTIASTLVVVCIGIPYVSPVFVVLGVPYVMVCARYARALRIVKRLDSVSHSPCIAVLQQSVSGLESIRAYGLQETLTQRHTAGMHALSATAHANHCAQLWAGLTVAGLGFVIVAAVTVLSVVLHLNAAAAVGAGGSDVIALSLSYMLRIATSMGSLVGQSATVDAAMNSAERVLEYTTDIEQEREVAYGPGPGQVPAPAPGWPGGGALSFRDVQLRYREGLPLVLKGVTFEVGAGQKVGVVGRTGSGKSSIMLTLFRMVELAGGRINLDGRDIATLRMADLRRQITIIPQDPTLFAGDIRSNLDPFHTQTDEALWDAIDRVGLRARLTEFAVEGPTGLRAPVAEKGSNFSVGQRQLMCLARALLKKSRVLLLDEATASVDFEADAVIQRSIRTQFRDCTVLTIAHRLATVMDADRILVLDAGVVAEFGEPQELLAKESGDDAVLRGMAEQLGPEQFEQLQEIARRDRSSVPVAPATF